jgi:hypothetical protein
MTRLRTLLLLLVATAFLLAGTPKPSLSSDFILCTCKTCKARPDVICQISPSGYSILCSDWAATHC